MVLMNGGSVKIQTLDSAKLSAALIVRTNLKAGGVKPNHHQALAVRSRVTAGGIKYNHNQKPDTTLTVRTSLKAGGTHLNHNQAT